MAIEDTTPRSTSLPVPGRDPDEGTITVPACATPQECAAMAAAIGAHLRDRQRAVADDVPNTVDRWKLAGRPGVADPAHLPRRIDRGQEWKAVDRTW